MRAQLSSALLLALFAFHPALAADPKPDAGIKTKAIEADVFLDDKIKADPALAADCLAEGKKWLDKNAGIAQIPVKEAMKIIAEKGLPSASAPEDKKK